MLTYLIITIIYAIGINIYFGGNFFPKSSEELICDGILIILVMMSINRMDIDFP